MSVSTSTPKTAQLGRSHPLAAIAAILAVIAVAAWAIATYAVSPGPRPTSSRAGAQTSALRTLTPKERSYALGILSLTPAQFRAAFGTSLTSVPGAGSGGANQPVRSSAGTQTSALRSLTPKERGYALGILSLSPAQFRAAFGTSPTSAAGRIRTPITLAGRAIY